MTSTKNIIPVDSLVSRTWSIAVTRRVDGGVEPDRFVRSPDVVVDGASDARDRDAVLSFESERATEAAIAADDHQPVDPVVAHLVHGLRPVRRDRGTPGNARYR